MEKKLDAFSYKYENVEQFRAVMQYSGFNEEYNNGILKFTRGDEVCHLSLEEIRSKISKDIFKSQELSKEKVCTFFDKDQVNNPKYTEILNNRNITLSENGIIIDHNNKVLYSQNSLFDYAYKNGYILDGKGTVLKEGEISKLMSVNGKKSKLYRGKDGVRVYPVQKELVIPSSILGNNLTKDQVNSLKNGEYIQLKSQGNNYFLQVDKDLNTVVIRSSREINIPNQIGGHQLSDLEKLFLLNSKYTPPLILKDEKTGLYFSAEITFSADKKEISYRNMNPLPTEVALQKIEEQKKMPKMEVTKVESLTDKLESKEEIDSKISSEDKKVLNCISTKDYKTINEMVSGGYKPSNEMLKKVEKLEISVLERAGVEKLLGIDTSVKEKVKIKEQDEAKDNIKQPVLNATNSMFQNM